MVFYSPLATSYRLKRFGENQGRPQYRSKAMMTKRFYLPLLLSAALFALPLEFVLHRAAQADGGGVGLGTRAPALLESLSKLSANLPGQTRPDGFSFEVVLLGVSARRWRLVGRFLLGGANDAERDLLIRYGSLQLEGG